MRESAPVSISLLLAVRADRMVPEILRVSRLPLRGGTVRPFRDLASTSILQGFPRRSIGDGWACNMPKQKTHKGTKKRFRLTATGKAKHRQAGTSLLASRKRTKTRRKLRGTKVVSDTVLHQITRALAGN